MDRQVYQHQHQVYQTCYLSLISGLTSSLPQGVYEESKVLVSSVCQQKSVYGDQHRLTTVTEVSTGAPSFTNNVDHKLFYTHLLVPTTNQPTERK